MQRRDFFKTGIAAGAGLSASSLLTSTVSAKTTAERDQRDKAKLRISSQLTGTVPGKTQEEKLATMKKLGLEAVECHGGVVGKGEEFKKMADDNGLEVSVICWGSHNGDLCKEDKSLINGLSDAMKQALETAGILKARGVIFVPAFANQTTLTNQEIRQRCLDFLPAMGEFAKQHNTHVILEPLCRMEAFFLRQVGDAAAICKDCGGPESGVAVMGDFYHMDTEEACNMGAFISAGPYLQHVHLAGGVKEPRRKLPGQNDTCYISGFRGLKYIGYTGFCSFECGCVGDNTIEFPKSVEFLRKQWDEA